MLDGHTGSLPDIVFNRDGTQIATASTDGTARVWSAAGVREYLSLEGHDQPVWVVAFSRDGKRLASGGLD